VPDTIAWAAILQRLYALDMVAPPDEEFGSPEGQVWPRFVTFDEGGRRAWESFYEGHQDLRENMPEAMVACHAKLESYAARFTLLIALLHMAEVDSCTPQSVPRVNDGAVECARRLVRYFLSHAARAYGKLDETDQDRKVEKAVDWIAQHGGQATVRDLVRNEVASVKSTSQAEALLRAMADRCLGIITSERNSSNGKDTVRFQLYGG
jgi:hypothetical protein